MPPKQTHTRRSSVPPGGPQDYYRVLAQLHRDANRHTISGSLSDISSSGQTHVPVPFDGYITHITGTLEGAIANADATVTVKDAAGGSMGTLTVAQSGSGAGSTFDGELTTNNRVSAGADVEVETNGGSTNAVGFNFVLTLDTREQVQGAD